MYSHMPPELEARIERHSLTPERAHPTDAGLDLRARHETELHRNKRTLVPLGVQVKIPPGFVGLLLPRSSLSKKYVVMMNSVGVIDSDYRGELMACLMYVGTEDMEVLMQDEKIVQLVIVPVALPDILTRYCDEETWNDTTRGAGGFGSTGN